MKTLQQPTVVALATALMAILFNINASAALPQGDYACQVETTGGAMGLVLVQSDSKEAAIRAARVANAITADSGQAAVAAVVQCISRRTEHFRDSDFQIQYLNTPL